ncbi:TIGR04149 family rSAM-modified RiPP [Bacteroides sp.]|uniref:TIGR04149 family rSAM-modified RiPP n=1 Tax=Bacteroides sp. TaxID=29523 RepID=UPI0023D10F30|nr:TIGR04149 family rSAM-modified RiPP [Bacteroides sp.]MDE6215721.1 TIGR04149 family rSAM-modified RiPP [Bacteroides sp.]
MNFNDLKAKAINKKQMRAIKGGSGTCGYKSPTGTVECGVSKKHAQFMATPDGYWCCDSCASSSYCG